MNLNEFAAWVRDRINAFMQNYLNTLDNDAPSLKEAMSYGLILGGKRSRPLLVYAVGKALGAQDANLDFVAAAVECIHAYSLIHDDMPEMDNDKLRRGNPTVHVKFGAADALLAGDALQTLGFAFISSDASTLSDSQKVKLCALLAKNAGYLGMCGGQAIDLASEGKHIPLEKLRLLHSKKTGALIKAAVLMGAICADADAKTLSILDRYATYVGLAFQVWDDVLDVIGDTKLIGKTVGSDISLDKSTYPALMGLEAAKQFANDMADKAIEILKELNCDTTLLQAFAKFTVSRDH